MIKTNCVVVAAPDQSVESSLWLRSKMGTGDRTFDVTHTLLTHYSWKPTSLITLSAGWQLHNERERRTGR
jgi:hypothetical protein